MLRRYKKLFRRHFSRSRIVVIAGVMATLFLTVNLAKEAANKHKINQSIDEYRQEAKRLQQENSEIESLIASWRSGGQLEKEARLKLGLQKPGENAMLILRNGNQKAPENVINPDARIIGGLVIDNNKANIPNYKKWFLYFFGKK